MKYLKRKTGTTMEILDNNPLSGVANLFDLGLMFMVGLLLALFTTYHIDQLFQKDSQVTITTVHADGRMEMVVKKGEKIEKLQVTDTQTTGKGQRLGIAYQLEDGSYVYVPDK